MISAVTDSPERGQSSESSVIFKIEYCDLLLKECCGVGSFGTVYCADWISQKKCVAVKVIGHLDEEVNILSTLKHHNIIKFYGACYETPNFCIVSEYAPYGSLYSFLSSSSGSDLMFTQMLRWAKDIASGMKYLHEDASIQVVHRDLKSKNILIGDDYCMKICDFGSSRVFDETVVMTFAGTYPWMAPELIQGLPTSTLCDVYSFGIVLWEILTREIPFKGLQGFQVAWIVVENHERPIIPSSCPHRLSNLIQQCWQGDPSFRPSFSEILERLDNILVDDAIEKETNAFAKNKCKWVEEMATRMTVIKNNELEMWAKDTAAEKRNAIIKQWSEKMGKELMKHSMSKYRYESFHRSVSFTDESQITVNSNNDSVTGKNGIVVKSDGQVKSSSIASHQKSSYQANVSHVSEEDNTLNLNMDHGKIMRTHSIGHDHKMKKQLSLGSLEFTGISDSERVTDYRRLVSTPLSVESVAFGGTLATNDMPKTVSVSVSPAVIFKAVAATVNMTHQNLSHLAHVIYENILLTSADLPHHKTNAVASEQGPQLKLCDVKKVDSTDVECQTISGGNMTDAATQTPSHLSSCDTSKTADLAFMASSIRTEQQSIKSKISGIEDQLQNSTCQDEFDESAEKSHAFHVWTAARDANFSGTIHKESVSGGWKTKKSLLRDRSFNSQFH